METNDSLDLALLHCLYEDEKLSYFLWKLRLGFPSPFFVVLQGDHD